MRFIDITMLLNNHSSSLLRLVKSSLIVVSYFFFLSLVLAERKLEFNRDTRPILSDGCIHCHGPDEKDGFSFNRYTRSHYQKNTFLIFYIKS